MSTKDWSACVAFHGHSCPGLAIGFQAAQLALKRLDLSFSNDEELVCVTENDACGVDAVQVLTGCTAGKGNLLFRRRGKMAFSFFSRDTGEGLRLILKRREWPEERDALEESILREDPEELFHMMRPSYEVPERAKIVETITCDICGEGVAENCIKKKRGIRVCYDCGD